MTIEPPGPDGRLLDLVAEFLKHFGGGRQGLERITLRVAGQECELIFPDSAPTVPRHPPRPYRTRGDVSAGAEQPMFKPQHFEEPEPCLDL